MLKDKIIVVTGGAGTIGRNFAQEIFANGGTSVVADINLLAAQDLVKQITAQSGGQAEAFYLDITDKSSIAALIEGLIQRHGRIDALINNAYPRNLHFGAGLEDVSYSDFCENVNTHLGGYFLAMQQFCMAFKSQGYGNVINISSIYGSMAPRFEIYEGTSMTMPVEYAAIKAGVENLTRYFASYYKQSGIRVNSLSPGGILGGQPPKFLAAYKRHCASKGMLEPADVIGTLLFLLSDASMFMTGQNLRIDDGFSL